MPRWFAAAAGMLLLGCGEAIHEPSTPQPLTVVVPPETGMATDYERTGFVGKWRHSLRAANGKDRTVELEYVKDQDGRERFEFLEHPWPRRPVFVEQVKNGDGSELRFHLTPEGGEQADAPLTLRYVLKAVQGTWTGKLFESWTTAPYDVVLTRSE